MKKYNEALLVLLSGILVGLAFTLDELSLIMWIGFIPFIYVFLRSVNTYKQGFKYGVVWGVAYYLIVLHWIFNLYPLDWIDIGKVESIIILVGGWIIISILEGIVIGVIFGFFTFLKSKSYIINILILSCLWVIMEWTLQIGVLGFPWARLAVSQVNSLSIVQSASLLGGLFISFLIVLVNGLITVGLINKDKLNIIKNKYLIAAILIFFINICFGFFRLSQKIHGNQVNISIVQGNIPTAQKWESGVSKEHLKIYKDLTIKAIDESDNKIDMLFWPETAIPINISSSKWLSDEYSNIAKDNDVNFMSGVFHTEFGEGINKDYNSVYYINSSGIVSEKYFKRQLVPFGETLPFKDILFKIVPVLEEANLFSGNLTAGEEAIVSETEFGEVGTAICYESIFPNLLRESVKDGAELIFVATNDSWFKDSRAVYQHNNNSVLRAIENNRYVVRAANTGISCVINNKGEIGEYLPPLERGYINSSVEFIEEKSVYTNVGDVIVLVAFLFIIIIYISIKTLR